MRWGTRKPEAAGFAVTAQRKLAPRLFWFALILSAVSSRPAAAQTLEEPPQTEQAPPTPVPAPQTGPATRLPSTPMMLTVGRGELLQFEDEASRVSVSDPAIADAVVISAHDVVLNGKSPGNTTIMIWHGNNISP